MVLTLPSKIKSSYLYSITSLRTQLQNVRHKSPKWKQSFFITDKLYFYSVRNLKHDFHHNSIMFAILIALLWEVKITIKSAVGMITTAGCRHLVRLTPVELGNIWRWRVAEIKHLQFWIENLLSNVYIIHKQWYKIHIWDSPLGGNMTV